MEFFAQFLVLGYLKKLVNILFFSGYRFALKAAVCRIVLMQVLHADCHVQVI